MDASQADGHEQALQVQKRDRERDFERFLTFVDAAVAIALTLLVLPVVDLAGAVTTHDETVVQLLRDHVPELNAFVISFVVISRLWFAQHSIMSTVVAHDRRATAATMVWLFLIVVLPFPTALIAAAGTQTAAKVLYVLTLALSSLSLAALCWALQRAPEARDSDEPPSAAGSLATALVFLLALALMLLLPVLSYWPLTLLITTDWLADRWRARGDRDRVEH